jgi:hypothetical protein
LREPGLAAFLFSIDVGPFEDSSLVTLALAKKDFARGTVLSSVVARSRHCQCVAIDGWGYVSGVCRETLSSRFRM